MDDDTTPPACADAPAEPDQPDLPGSRADDGAAAAHAEADRLARRLVQHVAAYEVDPPPPARAADPD